MGKRRSEITINTFNASDDLMGVLLPTEEQFYLQD